MVGMSFLLRPVQLLWKHRYIIRQTVLNDIRARYAGSILGLFWMFLYPLLFLGIYAATYLYIFHISVSNFSPAEYVTLIFAGLIPFIGFSDALATGVSSVSANANLIKNTLFPIELIPVKAVLASQATQFVGTMILLVAIVAVGKLTLFALLLPVIWFFQLAFCMGLAWLLSSLNVLIRDTQNIVSILILMLMLISPIAYTVDMIPPRLAPFIKLNPLYYFIVAYQNILVLGKLPPANILIVVVLLGILSFGAGYWLFVRLKSVFFDYA